MSVSEGMLAERADRTDPHAHSYYEIIWFEEGVGTHMIDFVDYPIEANTFFLIAPGQVHAFRPNVQARGIVIDFMPEVFPASLMRDNLYVRYNLFAEPTPRYVINDPELTGYLHHMVWALEEELADSNRLGHEDLLAVMLKVILLSIYRKADQMGAMSYTSNTMLLRTFSRFRQEIEQHYCQTRTVSDYADMLGVSVKQLSAAVQECSGSSPHVIIEERVILEAKRMLRCTGLMIREIAEELGFPDVSYFIKFFKNNVGVLPTDFRLQPI